MRHFINFLILLLNLLDLLVQFLLRQVLVAPEETGLRLRLPLLIVLLFLHGRRLHIEFWVL